MKSISNHKNQARFFNILEDHDTFFVKASTQKEKIIQEYNFFQYLPEILTTYYPKVYNLITTEESASYCIEKINYPDASFALLKNDDQEILALLKSLRKYLSLMPFRDVTSKDFLNCVQVNIFTKNYQRLKLLENNPHLQELELICRRYGHSSLIQFVDALNQYALNEIQNLSPKLYYLHGDLCFSNILSSAGDTFLIDPKGGDQLDDLYRPAIYDLAKISQSLLGGYDHINLNQFSVTENKTVVFSHSTNLPRSYDLFLDILSDFNLELKQVRLVEATLLFSMLPFHTDHPEKMSAFLIQSLKLYKELT